jgi:hypothetical protein
MYALFIHERELKSLALFYTFLLIPLKWKLQLRKKFKLFKKIQKYIYIVSNIFLDFY